MYSIIYDSNGNPCIVRSDGASIPSDPHNADFRAFLAWNVQQSTPLDYTTSIAPQGPSALQIAAKTAALRLKASYPTANQSLNDVILVLRALVADLN